jgi:AhpD family alkylhydroperoxidase
MRRRRSKALASQEIGTEVTKMENQSELFDEIFELRNKYQEAMPSVLNAQDGFVQEVYKDGAISHKTKRLISAAIAIVNGCTGCMLGQTKFALNAGATREEILEVIAVARSMGGTMAGANSYRVVKLLEELEKL